MFRLQDNVPDIYVTESRDFQLFCKLVDFIVNSTKYNIDSIVDLLDTTKINDNMLSLLATKLGFFPKYEYDSRRLRYMLAAFPYMMKYKGTKKGIEIATTAILKSESNTESPIINIVNKDDSGNLVYKIEIYTIIKKIENKLALRELLSYVVPTGYTLDVIDGYKKELEQPTVIYRSDIHYTLSDRVKNISTVYNSELKYTDPDEEINDMKERYISSYFHTQVVSAEDFGEDKNEGEDDENEEK